MRQMSKCHNLLIKASPNSRSLRMVENILILCGGDQIQIHYAVIEKTAWPPFACVAWMGMLLTALLKSLTFEVPPWQESGRCWGNGEIPTAGSWDDKKVKALHHFFFADGASMHHEQPTCLRILWIQPFVENLMAAGVRNISKQLG